jgi:hypothetical protein
MGFERSFAHNLSPLLHRFSSHGDFKDSLARWKENVLFFVLLRRQALTKH